LFGELTIFFSLSHRNCFLIKVVIRNVYKQECHFIYNVFSKSTWEMHPPSPMPSKNWWKLKAVIRGLIVFGLLEAPSDTPIITEWTRIPNSKICTTLCLCIQSHVLKAKFFSYDGFIPINKSTKGACGAPTTTTTSSHGCLCFFFIIINYYCYYCYFKQYKEVDSCIRSF